MSRLNLGDSLIMNSDIVVNGGEIKTGATFGGKPVYVQSLQVTHTSVNYGDSGNKRRFAALIINNVADVISVGGVVRPTNGNLAGHNIVVGGVIPIDAMTSINFCTDIYIDSSNTFRFVPCYFVGNNTTAETVKITVFYTKTTD